MLNDASWASFGFFNNNIFPNRIAKYLLYITQCRVIFRIDRTKNMVLNIFTIYIL